ncbi:LysM peptidoglycan-binding domain-containing protein [Ewingella sp. AOP8-B2-18]
MIFPSEEVGWTALNLLLKSVYKDMEVKNVAKRFAPATDNNDPEKYSKFIVRESDLNGDWHVRDLDETSLERLMEAIKKMEGYYNNQDTRRENIVPTTSIIVSDGTQPIINEKFKIAIGQCTYEWSTNKYGVLPLIAHLSDRERVDILATNASGIYEKIHSLTTGNISKNILLLKHGSIYTAKTGAHKQSEKTTSIYLVKKGETLSNIARKLHTTVKRIADLNNIKNINILSVGQKLKVPDGNALPQAVSSTNTLSLTNHRQTKTGSSDAGYPQANVSQNEEQAPWMKVAIEQAIKWAGKPEDEITMDINYHAEVGVRLPSLAGDSNPWCASFINYCLIKSEPPYPKSNAPAKAISFSTDYARFKKIDVPIYGSIAVFTRRGGGHVCFVYALSSKVNGNIIVLGGNQSDAINFVDRSLRGLVGYFIPIQYEKKALLEMVSGSLHKSSAEELNSSLNIDTDNNGREL